MSYFTLLSAIAKKHMTTPENPPRTPAPLRLSQGSAVDINIVRLVLAEQAKTLFDTDLPEHHTIIAVGQYDLAGLTFSHCYLSQHAGAYLHFATKAKQIVETRVYVPYFEQIPVTADDWAFWLSDVDGYIGYPFMQSKDEDGPQQYQRSWSAGVTRVPPMQASECIVDMAGATTTVNHQMMHYSRQLDASLAEHLLASAVETSDGMSVNFWLGIDLDVTDLTVFPAADAPKLF